MVHALTEAHRALRPGGRAVDFRPDRDPGGRRRKYLATAVVWNAGRQPAGELLESSFYYPDYLAAERAAERAVHKGLFSLAYEAPVEMRTHFRSLQMLERYLASDWAEASLPAGTRRNLTRLLERHPAAWIVVSDPFVLRVLRKT